MAAVFRKPWDEEVHTLTADAVAGDVVACLDGKAGVVSGLNGESFLSGAKVTVKKSGHFEIPSATATTITVGAICEIVSSTQLVVADAGGDFNIGRMLRAKLNGELVCQVLINDAGLTA